MTLWRWLGKNLEEDSVVMPKKMHENPRIKTVVSRRSKGYHALVHSQLVENLDNHNMVYGVFPIRILLQAVFENELFGARQTKKAITGMAITLEPLCEELQLKPGSKTLFKVAANKLNSQEHGLSHKTRVAIRELMDSRRHKCSRLSSERATKLLDLAESLQFLPDKVGFDEAGAYDKETVSHIRKARHDFWDNYLCTYVPCLAQLLGPEVEEVCLDGNEVKQVTSPSIYLGARLPKEGAPIKEQQRLFGVFKAKELASLLLVLTSDKVFDGKQNKAINHLLRYTEGLMVVHTPLKMHAARKYAAMTNYVPWM
jgi:hypothetical protein